jgi:hypothetical protein
MRRSAIGLLLDVVFCFPVAATQTITPPEQSQIVSFEQLSSYRPEMLRTTDCSALLEGLPMLAFLQLSPISSEMPAVTPAAEEVHPMISVSGKRGQKLTTGLIDAKDSPATTQPLEKQPLEYHGEVGLLYGRSTGKFGGDVKQGYMIGTVGDDKVQFTIGTSYQDWNVRNPRWGR